MKSIESKFRVFFCYLLSVCLIFIADDISSTLRISCLYENNDHQKIYKDAKLSLKYKDQYKTTTIDQVDEDKMSYTKRSLDITDSGIYICEKYGTNEEVTLHVYEITHAIDGLVPTESHDFLKHGRFLANDQIRAKDVRISSKQWMSCTCKLPPSVLQRITVSWTGGTLSWKKYNYEKKVITNGSSISAYMRLKKPVYNQDIFGTYKCLFKITNDEVISHEVNLFVAPILNLHVYPPPIPDKPNALDNACFVVVANPPVSDKSLIGEWSDPRYARYTVSQHWNTSTTSEEGQEDAGLGVMPLLERRKRSASIVHQIVNSPPDAPVTFSCQGENIYGATKIQWPGNQVKDKGVRSLWWPVLAIFLLVCSLIAVLAFEFGWFGRVFGTPASPPVRFTYPSMFGPVMTNEAGHSSNVIPATKMPASSSSNIGEVPKSGSSAPNTQTTSASNTVEGGLNKYRQMLTSAAGAVHAKGYSMINGGLRKCTNVEPDSTVNDNAMPSSKQEYRTHNSSIDAIVQGKYMDDELQLPPSAFPLDAPIATPNQCSNSSSGYGLSADDYFWDTSDADQFETYVGAGGKVGSTAHTTHKNARYMKL